MPNAVGTLTNINGYTTPIGNRALAAKKFSWNNGNYVAGGFIIGKNTFGLRGIDCGFATMSAGGNYEVEVQVAGPSAGQINVRLIVVATGIEVAGGAALTADSTVVMVIGG
jgi:DNA-directed RNA polymerase beta' subunit